MSSPIIGGLNEKSLHRQLKEHYQTPESRLEESIDGYIVDVVTPDELIEIQTGNFAGIRTKLSVLLQKNRVRLVYPVAAETTLLLLNEDNSLLSSRKSPKRGSIYSAAAELLYLAELLTHENLTIEVLLVRQDEIRSNDGRGSWRRRGISITDRVLVEIIHSTRFTAGTDYLRFLPDGLPSPFSNMDLAEHLPSTGTGARGKQRVAGQISYLLRKLELLEIAEKKGNRLLFALSG